MTVWPGNVNQIVDPRNFSEKSERNITSFAPEVGPTKDRRTKTFSSDVFSFTQLFSSVEFDALMSFYRNDLKSGTKLFTRNHPRTGVYGTYKFTAPPAVSSISGTTYTVALSMRLIPAAIAAVS